MFYAGIGSRETPDHIIDQMINWGRELAKGGYTLRSGGADGADMAFEIGCLEVNGPMEIYLPWRGFNKNTSPLYNIPEKAYEISREVHPAWSVLKEPVKKLMARNAMQVLGQTLDIKALFVVCWTPDGCCDDESRTRKTGGTGQAISLASLLDIPVFNLQRTDAGDNLIKFLNVLSETQYD